MRIAETSDLWWKNAVVYCLDVETFQDSDGDGHGDLRGLISRLDYLARLGVTTLWLNPIHPSPGKDYGYDVSDRSAAVRAFQRRFRRGGVDGVIDGQCRAILLALLLEGGRRTAR